MNITNKDKCNTDRRVLVRSVGFVVGEEGRPYGQNPLLRSRGGGGGPPAGAKKFNAFQSIKMVGLGWIMISPRQT